MTVLRIIVYAITSVIEYYLLTFIVAMISGSKLPATLRLIIAFIYRPLIFIIAVLNWFWVSTWF